MEDKSILGADGNSGSAGTGSEPGTGSAAADPGQAGISNTAGNPVKDRKEKAKPVKASTNFVIDIIALVVYVVVANPLVTGLLLHEWISLGIIVVFLVHLATHIDWCIDVCKRGFTNPSLATTGNLILDIVTLLTFMVVTVSGILVSRHVLPLFDLVAPGYFLWNPVHSISAKVLLALLVLHVVVHWRWLWTLVANRFRKEETDHDRQTDLD